MGFLFATIGGNLQIRFNNWDKYQPRKDIKNPWWVALKNDFATNPNFLKFTKEEKLCFIYLMCEASKTNQNGMLFIDFDFMSDYFCMTPKVIMQTIDKLEKRGIIGMDEISSVQIRTDPYKSVPTDRQTDRQTPDAADAADYDFEALYQTYPKKIGKAKAFGVLKNTIKTKEDYDALALAITNYSSLVQKEKVESRFIKHFSTFVGSASVQSWRDYVSIEKSESKKQNRSYFYENKKITEEEFFELKKKGLV